jgi:predicted acetyltransferase
LLSNLLSLYMHDMSGMFPVRPGPDGRFVYEKLPRYWSEPGRRFPFLIYAGAEPAGFALVSRGSPVTHDPEDLDIAEFFVLRSHRHGGIGRQAAFLLWGRLPGNWVVRVSEANQEGVRFWRSAIDDYTRGAFIRATRPGSPHDWQVFTFTVGT